MGQKQTKLIIAKYYLKWGCFWLYKVFQNGQFTLKFTLDWLLVDKITWYWYLINFCLWYFFRTCPIPTQNGCESYTKNCLFMEKWFLAHKSSFLWGTCPFLFFLTFPDPKELPVLISSLGQFFWDKVASTYCAQLSSNVLFLSLLRAF